MTMLLRLQLASVILCLARLVYAGIYGTYPIASSVLSAGRLTTIRWIDDGKSPFVKDVGLVKIDLYIEQVCSHSQEVLFEFWLCPPIVPVWLG